MSLNPLWEEVTLQCASSKRKGTLSQCYSSPTIIVDLLCVEPGPIVCLIGRIRRPTQGAGRGSPCGTLVGIPIRLSPMWLRVTDWMGMSLFLEQPKQLVCGVWQPDAKSAWQCPLAHLVTFEGDRSPWLDSNLSDTDVMYPFPPSGNEGYIRNRDDLKIFFKHSILVVKPGKREVYFCVHAVIAYISGVLTVSPFSWHFWSLVWKRLVLCKHCCYRTGRSQRPQWLEIVLLPVVIFQQQTWTEI